MPHVSQSETVQFSKGKHAQPRARPNIRPDHNGTQRAQFESNKKKIYATQTHCGICGKEVDFAFKFPHPLSPCIDHIIPVARGGHCLCQ